MVERLDLGANTIMVPQIELRRLDLCSVQAPCYFSLSDYHCLHKYASAR